nr:MAG TPA: hypothetical protein [Caudoviricetes sp.]
MSAIGHIVSHLSSIFHRFHLPRPQCNFPAF